MQRPVTMMSVYDACMTPAFAQNIFKTMIQKIRIKNLLDNLPDSSSLAGYKHTTTTIRLIVTGNFKLATGPRPTKARQKCHTFT